MIMVRVQTAYLGFMLKKHITSHLRNRKCPEQKLMIAPLQRKPKSESAALISGICLPNFDTDFVDKIINKMKDDTISSACKSDELILNFGNMIFQKYRTTQCELIRQSMRQLGRLILQVKKIDPQINSLSDCLNPQNFDKII